MPIPVSDTENAICPSGARRINNLDLSRFGEFERVGQQIFEHLFESLHVGLDARGALRCNLGDEVQLLFLSDRLKELSKIVGQSFDGYRFRPDLHVARLNFGQDRGYR